MKLHLSAFRLIPLLLLILSMWSAPLWAAKVRQVLIVANSMDEPYRQAIDGYKKQLSSTQTVKFTERYLVQADDPDSLLSAEIRNNPPDLIYSLGGEATEASLRNTSTIPIVATMILKRFSYKHASNITGVYLNYPLTIQFEWLKKFFPEQKKIAIFFNPEENTGTIREARQIAGQQGLDLIPIPVETPRELPYALDQLKSNVEILLAIPDEVAMSSKTAKEVLLASFRNRVPLVGLSDNWVKSGAFYSLSWDYEDLGRQCAIQSDTLIKGIPIQNVPVEYPRKTAYSINAKIAEHMNIEISQALLKNAKLIFN
ncbi:ABC transporter substrate-binding protein [Methylosarcina fibrata]|uniref:ABC transporter substrate-binding protein n=1 Tax=Methylosarcina fibrata TaxID=105972 RepID=UPI000379B73F|nr:ABC transporter substrate-binding protein [Methylosarcina fibrata]